MSHRPTKSHCRARAPSRRDVLAGTVGCGTGLMATAALAAVPKKPYAQPALPLPTLPALFSSAYVVDYARALATRAYDAQAGLAAPELRALSPAAYGSISFRNEHTFLADSSGPFRLQLFPLGSIYQRAVNVNIVRAGKIMALPATPDVFDFSRTGLAQPLPAMAGYAGFRLYAPLNEAISFDEVMSFLGASNFRFLGRGQSYGLYARAVAVDAASPGGEEFPHFREFWLDVPEGKSAGLTIHALLDSPSLTGAYQFRLTLGLETQLEVKAALFARQNVKKLGLAPLASMYFYSETQARGVVDYRPEIHNSDGLQINNGAGEWLWRPLRNPEQLAVSSFVDKNPRGFGLTQRDRAFDHYQDLHARVEQRPSYWAEPLGAWDEGVVELVEIPSPDESHDNILASWVRKTPLQKGETLVYGYKLRALSGDAQHASHPGGRVVATYQKKLLPFEAPEANDPDVRRFFIDFSGDNLAFYLNAPQRLQPQVDANNGTVLRSFVDPHLRINGFRLGFDVKAQGRAVVDLRAALAVDGILLTEIWTYPWRVDG